MSLILLPDLSFPVTPKSADGLMVNLVQLNMLDAGLNERQQKALDIVLDTYELKAKSKGEIDYTGKDGHQKLFQHAMSFCGEGNPVVTRHGDLAAAHLAINYNNAQMKLKAAGMPLVSPLVSELLLLCGDICAMPQRTEARCGLFLSYLQKRKLV